MFPAMKAPVSSPEALQAMISFPVIVPYYRAEFNPLSGRWMVLGKYDECMRAGLSQSAAIEYAGNLNVNA